MTSKKIGIALIGLVLVISIGAFFVLGYRAEVTSPITVTKTTPTTVPTTYTTYTIVDNYTGQHFTGNLTTPVQAGNATMSMFSFGPTSLSVQFIYQTIVCCTHFEETFNFQSQAGEIYNVSFANYSFRVSR